MAEQLRHRQTKEAATDMFYLTPPRHISTLPIASIPHCNRGVRSYPDNGHYIWRSGVSGIGSDRSVSRLLQTLRCCALICARSMFGLCDPMDSGPRPPEHAINEVLT